MKIPFLDNVYVVDGWTLAAAFIVGAISMGGAMAMAIIYGPH